MFLLMNLQFLLFFHANRCGLLNSTIICNKKILLKQIYSLLPRHQLYNIVYSFVCFFRVNYYYNSYIIYIMLWLKVYLFIVIWEIGGVTFNRPRKGQCYGDILPDFMDLILTHHGNTQQCCKMVSGIIFFFQYTVVISQYKLGVGYVLNRSIGEY